MGNLFWNKDGWYIDNKDKVNIGESIEVEQPDGSWKKITVAKDANEVFHPDPHGTSFNTGMKVRRIK